MEALPANDEGMPGESDEFIASYLGKHIPRYLMEKYKAAHKTLREDMGKLIKINERITRTTADLDALSQGRTPPGTRPFRIPFNCVELDEPLSNDDVEISLSIPAGTTIRMAKEILHIFTLKKNKEWDKQMSLVQQSTLQAAVTLDKFVGKCSESASSHATALNSLGISLPPGLSDVATVSRDRIVALYVDTVNSVAEQMVKSADAKAAKEAQEQKILDEVARRDPAEHLENAINQVISKRFSKGPKKKKRVTIDNAGLAQGAHPGDAVTFNEIPAAPKAKPKSKSKPKNKVPSKPQPSDSSKGNKGGKSKGKGKSKDKGKGKSKGSGKGKSKDIPAASGKGNRWKDWQQESPYGGKGGKSKGKGKGSRQWW